MSKPDGSVDLMSDGAVATITINNPAKRNSFNSAMMGQLAAAGRSVQENEDIACVVLRGSGNAFCAGLDFDTLTADLESPDYFADLDSRFTEAIGALERVAVPVIAEIHGGCMGGGVQLAMAADIRIAAVSARLGIPAARFGIVYPLPGLQALTRLGGGAAVKHLLWSGEPIDAMEAQRIGWFDSVQDDANVGGYVAALASQIASYPGETVKAYKSILDGLAGAVPMDDLAPARDRANRIPQLTARLRAVRDKRKS